MEDDRNLQPKSNAGDRDDIDDQIDSLTPVPSDEHPTRTHDVGDELDALLPEPGVESLASDDATTSEEMEVDTTNDDNDDIIDVSNESPGVITGFEDDGDEDDLAYLDVPASDEAKPVSTEIEPVAAETATDEDMNIDGERYTWQAVEDQPDPIDSDNEPINEDSEFFSSNYQREERADSSGEGVTEADSADGTQPAATEGVQANFASESEITHQCPACGTAIAKSPYCPHCGTDQYPSSRLSTILQPLLSWSRPLAIRSVLLVGFVLALLALLSDSGTTALIIAAITMPIVLMVRISMQLTSHTKTGWIQMGLMAFVGFAIGLPLAWFGARMVRDQWFDTGVLNFGAAGFGGNFAEAAGAAPFFVWLVVGLLIPVVLVLAIGAIPVALRMVMNMPPRESSGMVLSGSVAAGYAIASGIIFYRPLYEEMMPLMSTSQWTLTIFGLAVIRPLVWVLGGAMIGAVVWRYLRTASPASIMMPAVIAGVLVIGFSLLSLAAGPAGHWAETLIGLVFAVASVFFYQRFLITAIRNDGTINAEK